MTRKIELKCDLCGIKVGEIEGNESVDDFVDVRCFDCEQAHGSYKELVETFERETGKGFDKFRLRNIKTREGLQIEIEQIRVEESNQDNGEEEEL
jgi:hypothetical protein